MVSQVEGSSYSDGLATIEVSIPYTQLKLSSLISALLSCTWAILVVVNYVFVTLPSKVVYLLHIRFLVTLSILLMLFYLAITASLSYIIVRHKYLTSYSKNSPAKPEKSKLNSRAGVDLANTRKKRGTDKSKNYLDEFLSAIKVFGYLEAPVFHELTKSMTTQKLSPGEILYLEENIGFPIVVEGTVQVYTKMDLATAKTVEYDSMSEQDLEDVLIIGDYRYQLLNEVKSGSPLSSLLDTLDLFSSSSSLASPVYSPPLERSDSKPDLLLRKDHGISSDSIRSSDSGFPWKDKYNPHFLPSLDPSMTFESQNNGVIPDGSSFHVPDIVVRPKRNSNDPNGSAATIAIIPRQAFQRVQAKYPKATSHIVTMVIMRLYKVTMNAIHNYLGLTKEIFEAEVALNSAADEYKLPSYLYDSAMENFKLDDSGERNLESKIGIYPKSQKKPRNLNPRNSSRYVVLASRTKASHPGDLLSSVPLSRRPDLDRGFSLLNQDEDEPIVKGYSVKQKHEPLLHQSYPSKKINLNEPVENIRNRVFSDEMEETEETSLRVAIVEIIFKYLGIDETSLNINISGMLNGQLSSNGSFVGLSALMSNDFVPSSGGTYMSDFFPGSSKLLLKSSTSENHRPSFSSSQKLYNTIYETKDNPTKKDGKLFGAQGRGDGLSTPSNGVDFSSIKGALTKHIEIKYYPPGETLISQESFETGLYYVIDGKLDILLHSQTQSKDDNSVPKKLYSINPGGLAGYLSAILGSRSVVNIIAGAEKGAVIAHISKKNLSRFMDLFPFLQLPIALKLKSLLPEVIRTIDSALEWCHIPAGGILCNQGDLANGFHIVLSGRFRVIRHKNSRETSDTLFGAQNLIDDSKSNNNGEQDYEVLGEYGHGQSIGEVEVLTASRRTNSLIAVRDSETARIPRSLFKMLSLRNPSIMVRVSRIVATRAIEMSKSEKYATAVATVTSSRTPEINSDYKTITILPSVSGLPVREFSENLIRALKEIGRKAIALDNSSILTHLGRHAFDEKLGRLKLSGFFAFLEEEYDTVVYVCDTPLKSDWTSTCISQGDCILLLADAEDDECATSVGDYEKILIKLKTTARTDLCLIHQEKSVFPGSTSLWLKNRLWVQGHHHIQMQLPRDSVSKSRKQKKNILADLALKLSSKANPNIKLKLESVRSRAFASLAKLNRRVISLEETPIAHKNDFLRLARILSNQSVGLVLGGGGSRGISHVGVVTALEKHGIPVDMIGGTSIGSFVGGLYAKEYNIVSIYGLTKKFSRRIGSIWRSIFDLTYPVTSYITGYEFNRGIWKVFGYHEIEDFWIKYYCNSTNITNSTMEIHESGYAWRFIRASMSLAGLLPPITFNGSMLLDGGYLDNLPVLEMKNRGAKYIIAVDVGSVDDRTPMNYGDTLSGFWVLFNKINPFSKHPNVPNMMEIQLRLAYVASVNALEMAKRTLGVIYLRPPIDDYATLDFLKFDEIYNVGLVYADNILSKWKSDGRFPSIPGLNTTYSSTNSKRSIYRRNSI